jgi:hypothetical protein
MSSARMMRMLGLGEAAQETAMVTARKIATTRECGSRTISGDYAGKLAAYSPFG